MPPASTLREDLAAQRDFVRTRAPVYARLLELLDACLDDGLEARLAEAWRDRTFGAFYERPLLLLAGLRDDALREGASHPLWEAVAGPDPRPGALDRPAVEDALTPSRDHFWSTVATRFVQTNEPSRAVAWLWPAHLAWQARPDRPLALFDVGASAGLNLVADHLRAEWETEDGTALEVAPRPPVVERTGYDPRPLDPLDAADARWLRACVWPGQGDREARLEEALAAFRQLDGASAAPRLHVARAGEVPERLPVDDHRAFALVYQTIVRDYIPAPERRAYEAGLRGWLERRPPGSALWVELEVTEAAREGGTPAALTAHVRGPDGVRSLELAGCEPHPRRLTVDRRAVAGLLEALGAAPPAG